MTFKNWHALAFVFLAVVLVYYPALFAPLNPIDDVRMVNDLLNRSALSWRDFIFPDSKSFYRPLLVSSFLLDKFLWNLETSFLHLGNVLLHLCNSLLVFTLARRVALLQSLRGVAIPFCAALFFGLHPVNTEAVIWVAGRADLLAGFFVLLTLHSALIFYQIQNRRWLIVTALAFFVGCLAKETVLFVWPGLLVAGWLVSREQPARGLARLMALRMALLPAAGCVFSIACYFALRSYALHDRDLGIRHLNKVLSKTPDVAGAIHSASSPDLSLLYDKVAKVLTVFGFYVRKIVQPFPLNFGIVEVGDGYLWVGLLAAVACLCLLLRVSWSGVFFLTAASLTSVAVLVAFGGLSWTPIAERYLYAPSAMVAIGVSLAGGQLFINRTATHRSQILLVLTSLVVAVFAVGTFQRTLLWRDNVALFRDTVDKSPDFAMGRDTLAFSLMQRGEHDKAIEILRDLEVPDFQVASLNKVVVFLADGEYEKARNYLVGRLNNPGAYRRIILQRLVKILVILGDNTDDPLKKSAYQTEKLTYLVTLWQTTHEPFYLYQIGKLQMQMGDYQSAQQSFSEAYQAFPADSMYKKPAGKLAEAMKSQ